MINKYSRPTGASRRPNGPLRTFTELAEEFGVSQQHLAAMMGHHPEGRPKPWSRHTSITYSKTYYEANAMRTWWRSFHEETTS